jgi:hypothetical protein
MDSEKIKIIASELKLRESEELKMSVQEDLAIASSGGGILHAIKDIYDRQTSGNQDSRRRKWC